MKKLLNTLKQTSVTLRRFLRPKKKKKNVACRIDLTALIIFMQDYSHQQQEKTYSPAINIFIHDIGSTLSGPSERGPSF